jgi:hypothetical protein
MTTALLAALAAALAASVFTLGREVRLRKALEILLKTILSRWRAHVSKTERTNLDGLDRTRDPDQWL